MTSIKSSTSITLGHGVKVGKAVVAEKKENEKRNNQKANEKRLHFFKSIHFCKIISGCFRNFT